VFSFLPVLRRGLINLEGYTAFSLFPHLSAIPHLTQSKGQRSSGLFVHKNKESDFDLNLGGAGGSDIAK
jgi:hypothetical protein